MRLVGQERYEKTKANIVSLFKHLESEILKLNNISSNPSISQALEAELTIWRKRNEKRMSSSLPASDVLKDTNALLEEQITQLENNLADAKFDLHKHQTRAERLERQLSDVLHELHNKSTTSSVVTTQDTATTSCTPVAATTSSVADNSNVVTSNPITAAAAELAKTEVVGHVTSTLPLVTISLLEIQAL